MVDCKGVLYHAQDTVAFIILSMTPRRWTIETAGEQAVGYLVHDTTQVQSVTAGEQAVGYLPAVAGPCEAHVR